MISLSAEEINLKSKIDSTKKSKNNTQRFKHLIRTQIDRRMIIEPLTLLLKQQCKEFKL